MVSTPRILVQVMPKHWRRFAICSADITGKVRSRVAQAPSPGRGVDDSVGWGIAAHSHCSEAIARIIRREQIAILKRRISLVRHEEVFLVDAMMG